MKWKKLSAPILLVFALAEISLAQRDTLNDPAYLGRRATERYFARDHKGLLSYLLRLQALRPDSPPLSYNLACAYAPLGEKGSALQWLR